MPAYATQEINSSDLLDIIFADRNKLYGAYILRRGYNQRLTKALLMTVAIVVLVLAAYYSAGKITTAKISPSNNDPVRLVEIDPTPKAPVPPPPPQPPPLEKVATIKNLVPVIVHNDLVDEPPPTVDELDNKRLGSITSEGIEYPDIVAPPVEGSKGIIEAPQQRKEEDGRYVPVEIESSYPSGPAAWMRYLMKTVKFPESAQLEDVSGPVVVSFIVDKDGSVSNVKIVSGPEALQAEAVRVISKSGKWIPAVQNGHFVKSVKLQRIVFELQSE